MIQVQHGPFPSSAAGVDALSGYVSTHGGSTVAFSILLNGEKSGADARALIDAICEAIVEY